MYLIDMFNQKTKLPDPQHALKGRAEAIETAETHFVFGTPLRLAPAENQAVAYFGMGRFWAAEKVFWSMPGVVSTAVGYAGGFTPNPTYQETLTGLTGHAEVARVVFDPAVLEYGQLLRAFFENHDPTLGMRQGSDIGTNYRSAIYADSKEQTDQAHAVKEIYQTALNQAGHGGRVTTEVKSLEAFYFAEAHHQQYLAKNPGATCALRGTGVTWPSATGIADKHRQ